MHESKRERDRVGRDNRSRGGGEAGEEGEEVRSVGFVFSHNGGAKRPQTVGLWGVFSSSARDVLPRK